MGIGSVTRNHTSVTSQSYCTTLHKLLIISVQSYQSFQSYKIRIDLYHHYLNFSDASNKTTLTDMTDMNVVDYQRLKKEIDMTEVYDCACFDMTGWLLWT